MAAIDQLQQQVDAYTRAHQQPPARWSDLNPGGPRDAVPVDPAGVPFEFNSATGRVVLSANSPLFPLPAHLGAR
jgi:hypothetical protein